MKFFNEERFPACLEYDGKGMLNIFEETIEEFVQRHRHIYLYGAGKYGEACFHFLQEKGIPAEGFIVTEKSVQERCGQPVYAWEEIADRLDADCGVVLSMKEAYQKSVASKLRDGGIDCISPSNNFFGAILHAQFVNLTGLRAGIARWERECPQQATQRETWRRILVIQLEVAIGDNIWSSAFLRELRRNFPRADITYVVSETMHPLVARCPYVDRIIGYPSKTLNDCYSEQMEEAAKGFAERHLQDLHADVAFSVKALPSCPWDALENAILSVHSGAKTRVAHMYDVTEMEHYFCDLWRNLFPLHERNTRAEHDVSKDLGLLRVCGLSAKDERMEVWAGAEARVRAREAFAGMPMERPLVRVAIGVVGREMRRDWPATRYARLANRLRKRVGNRLVFVLFGGENAVPAAEEIAQSALPCVNLAGCLTLEESCAAMALCDFYLGSDTSLMHMAAACGLPVIELSANLPDGDGFDQGAPERTGPWKVPGEVVRPPRAIGKCTHLCRKPYVHCMKSIPVRRVQEAVLRMARLTAAQGGKEGERDAEGFRADPGLQ